MSVSGQLGVGAKLKTPAQNPTPSQRELRSKPAVDYKSLHEGRSQEVAGTASRNSVEDELPDSKDPEAFKEHNENPWGASRNDVLRSGWEIPENTTVMAGEQEICMLQRELEALGRQEEELLLRKKADDLRRQLEEKKKAIASLRGNSLCKKVLFLLVNRKMKHVVLFLLAKTLGRVT